MKYGCFITLVLAIVCNDIHAQFEDSYGRLRPQDVDIKECSFDPSASLVKQFFKKMYNLLEEACAIKNK